MSTGSLRSKVVMVTGGGSGLGAAFAISAMRIGMGRMGTADEIAELVRFLAGPESSYSTGDVYAASGGYQ